jgi:hypothetical protein
LNLNYLVTHGAPVPWAVAWATFWANRAGMGLVPVLAGAVAPWMAAGPAQDRCKVCPVAREVRFAA